MKRIAILLLLAVPMMVQAQRIRSDETVRTSIVDLRVSASYEHEWSHPDMSLGISEEMSAYLYQTDQAAYFRRTYTTIDWGYHPIDHLSIGAGYTLKLYCHKGWSDPNEFLRHRVFVRVGTSWKVDQWKFSLRERLDIDMRTDSVNPLEKNATDLRMRHKLEVGYTMRNQPLKYYLSCELVNTLNAPVKVIPGEGQYLSSVRPSACIRWRMTKGSSLSLSYTFQYDYDRDLNIKRKSGDVEITRCYDFHHIIQLAYEFGD